MKKIVLALVVLVLVLVPVSFAFALGDAGPDAVSLVDAGFVDTYRGAKPSEAIRDPLAQPAAAWDDVKAARKTSWPLAVLLVAIMLTRALAVAGKKVTWLAWLSKGKAAFALAGVLAVATASFDVLVLGGSWVAVLTAAAAAGFALLVPDAKPATKDPA